MKEYLIRIKDRYIDTKILREREREREKDRYIDIERETDRDRERGTLIDYLRAVSL